MKFMFSTVYRVTQKDFYARPYTSVWLMQTLFSCHFRASATYDNSHADKHVARAW
jgi:hypothetical protein